MQETINKKPISIHRAMKVVASDNYDKKNIFLYFLVILVTTILSFSIQDKEHPNLICSVLLLLISIFSNAIYIVATHNAIHKRKGVFPDILKNFSSICKTGVALSSGSIFWTFSMIIIAGILFFVLHAGINPVVAAVIATILLLILATFCIGACFNFFISLSIKDWFNFKKALLFMKKAKKYFGAYMLRCILLPLLGGIFLIPIYIVFGILGAFTKGELNVTSFTGIAILIMSVIGTIISVYYVEITAQFIRAALNEQKNVAK